MAEINVTPLVDIILVLLIIFMLTANLLVNPAIKVELPKASTGEINEPTLLSLTLTRAGDIYLNGSITDEAGVIQYVRGLTAQRDHVQAVIAADQEVSHGRVIHLIDVVRQYGVYRFSLNIDPVVEPKEGGVDVDSASTP